MAGFGNSGGADPCVACKAAGQPFMPDVVTAKVKFILRKNGQAIDWAKGGFSLENVASRSRIVIQGSKDERLVPVGIYEARLMALPNSLISGYEGVSFRASLGKVVIGSQTKQVALEMPQLVNAKVQLPFVPQELVLWNEATGIFTIPGKGGSEFGIETSREKAGQFSFSGPPGRYVIYSNAIAFDSLNVNTFGAIAPTFLPARPDNWKTWAAFDVPPQGSESPIPVDIKVHKVVVRVILKDGELVCGKKCSYQLASSRGAYRTFIDPMTDEPTAFVPHDTYRLLVSGTAFGQSMILPLGLHEIDADKIIKDTGSWSKVTGKVSMNGMAIMRATGSPLPFAKVAFLDAQRPIGLGLVTVAADPDGKFEAWVPSNLSVVPQLDVVLFGGGSVKKQFTARMITAEQSGLDFNVQTKLVQVKPLPPDETTVLRQFTLTNESRDSLTFTSPVTREFPIGDYRVGISTAQASFSDVATVSVSPATDVVEIHPTGQYISGKVPAGAARLTFERQAAPTSTGPQRNYVGTATTDDQGVFTPFWLASGQYFVNGDLGYLGCVLVP